MQGTVLSEWQKNKPAFAFAQNNNSMPAAANQMAQDFGGGVGGTGAANARGMFGLNVRPEEEPTAPDPAQTSTPATNTTPADPQQANDMQRRSLEYQLQQAQLAIFDLQQQLVNAMGSPETYASKQNQLQNKQIELQRIQFQLNQLGGGA